MRSRFHHVWIRAENHIEVGEDETDDEIERNAKRVVHCCPHLVSGSKQSTMPVSTSRALMSQGSGCFLAAWPGAWDVIQVTRFAIFAVQSSATNSHADGMRSNLLRNVLRLEYSLGRPEDPAEKLKGIEGYEN